MGGKVPTAEDIARADYTWITENANIILFGDALGYRPGATTAQRAPTICRGTTCSIGFGRPFLTKNFSVEGVELKVLSERNGVRLVSEDTSNKHTENTVFGGWMKYSFFASQATRYVNEENPNQGTTVFYPYVLGTSTGQNPSVPMGGAQWLGFVVGRDSSAKDQLDSFVQGDAAIRVEMGQTGVQADVRFTDMVNKHTGATYGDMTWTGMAVSKGGFARRGADDDKIEGRFFGPDQQEVGGLFERAGIAGAFGGRQPQE